MKEEVKLRLLKSSVDFRLYDAINTFGVKETKSLLLNFILGEELELGLDEGFIVSMFLGWWNGDVDNEFKKPETVIANFISYSQWKWEREKSKIYWLQEEEDIDIEIKDRTVLKKFTEKYGL